jgi:hypothetical protein
MYKLVLYNDIGIEDIYFQDYQTFFAAQIQVFKIYFAQHVWYRVVKVNPNAIAFNF